MKVTSLRFVLRAAILATVLSAAARVDSAEPGHSRRGLAARTEHGGVAAKAEYCTDCHGPSGQGYHGYLTCRGSRDKHPSTSRISCAVLPSVAGSETSSSTWGGCTASVRTFLDPRPIGGGPSNAVATGKRIYDEGIPEANIPACAACHGPDARGQEAIPRLAGQLYAYTVKELTNWSRERAQGAAKDDTSAVMTPIARALTPAQVSAIAAYLRYLR